MHNLCFQLSYINNYSLSDMLMHWCETLVLHSQTTCFSFEWVSGEKRWVCGLHFLKHFNLWHNFWLDFLYNYRYVSVCNRSIWCNTITVCNWMQPYHILLVEDNKAVFYQTEVTCTCPILKQENAFITCLTMLPLTSILL